jgi:hypothetical protein
MRRGLTPLFMEDDTTSASPEENKALVLKAFNTCGDKQ